MTKGEEESREPSALRPHAGLTRESGLWCSSLKGASGRMESSPANDAHWKSFEFCRSKPVLSSWAVGMWPGANMAMGPESQRLKQTPSARDGTVHFCGRHAQENKTHCVARLGFAST